MPHTNPIHFNNDFAKRTRFGRCLIRKRAHAPARNLFPTVRE